MEIYKYFRKTIKMVRLISSVYLCIFIRNGEIKSKVTFIKNRSIMNTYNNKHKLEKYKRCCKI
jgi:hypothetical protein